MSSGRLYAGLLRRLRPRLLRHLPYALTRRAISGRGNRVMLAKGAQLVGARIDIAGNDNLVEIGADAVLHRVLIYIRGNGNRVSIGAGCRVSRNAEFWQEDDHTVIQVGARTTIESAHLAATENGSRLLIGEDCMLAYDIDIRTGDSHAILKAADGERLNPAASVELADRVWLAAHVRVLKGVRLGTDTVVGTGSVVTRSSEECGVALAGNPARIVRRGIRWSADRRG